MNLLQQIGHGIGCLIDDVMKAIGTVIAGAISIVVITVMVSPLLFLLYIPIHFILKYW